MKTLKNIALFLVATVLFIILGPIGFLYWLITRLKFWLSNFFFALAISIDQLWNTFAQYLLDDIMITKDWYKFWDVDDTVSRVLGVNQRDWTLKKPWKMLCRLLSVVENLPDIIKKLINKKHKFKRVDHCKKSI